ncbi:hypothetical protein [uncultured Bacteroides sp.]|uniref:hypothetical protein n=1 Tax=uncultured Bacteroides sp. TaxID=162156 RepID=UPI00258E6D3B|nr:hypothetical protein [uncultured Bacteroides sp.]
MKQCFFGVDLGATSGRTILGTFTSNGLEMRKAKQLLVGTSLSVKEISFMLDYKSTEHFSYGRETGGEEEWNKTKKDLTPKS